MAKTKGIGSRMADFYFEIEGPDGKTEVVQSKEAKQEEADTLDDEMKGESM